MQLLKLSLRVLIALAALTAIATSSAWAADPQAAAPMPQKSLYERLGGLMPISVVVSDFIDALVPDATINKNPNVAAARARVPAAYLKFQVTALVCQVTGGPCKYSGRTMKDSHAQLHITEPEWDRMATIFKQVLDRYAVPDREQQELFAVVGSTKGDIVEARR